MSTKTADFLTSCLTVYNFRAVRERVCDELTRMARHLGMQLRDEPFAAMFLAAAEHLFEIEKLCCDGDINPCARLRTSDDQQPCPPYPQRLRIGFYPIAANPLHWGHVLIGLRAMAKLQLDKIVYVIAGCDSRKPDMCSADARLRIAGDTLGLFDPLFACSTLARRSSHDGETNLFRFLKLNRQQPLDMFYIAGGDHCRRLYPGTRYPDTLAKLELHTAGRIFSYNPEMHWVSGVFINRRAHDAAADTSLEVHFLEVLPFAASSTMIRDALNGTGRRKDLAILPYSIYADICAMDLYGKESHGPVSQTEKSRFCTDAIMAVA